MKEYYKLDKTEINKRYGLSGETFNFYMNVGLIKKLKNEQYYLVDKKIDKMHLEKNTVFKYCFDDNWLTDLKSFFDNIKYSSDVKYYSKEEISEMNKKLKNKD